MAGSVNAIYTGASLTNLLQRVRSRLNRQFVQFIRYNVVLTVKQLYGKRPVNLLVIRVIHRFIVLLKKDLSDPPVLYEDVHLYTQNRELTEILENMRLRPNKWVISMATLKVISEYIHKEKPKVFIEFGSGLSTLWLADQMLNIFAEDQHFKFVSIEQDEEYLVETSQLLERVGLLNVVTLIHAPKAEQTIEGYRISSYSNLQHELRKFLQVGSVDMVLIDGPSGMGRSRFVPLYQLRQFLKPGARVFLDDALRPYELEVIDMWLDRNMLKPEGIILVERGLFTGMY